MIEIGENLSKALIAVALCLMVAAMAWAARD